jgi:hypothetical protein
VDVVFAPAVEEVYPGGEPLVRVVPGPMGAELEGATRPGHFSGMLTVVAKLLEPGPARLAFFGEKDYQQLALIQRWSRPELGRRDRRRAHGPRAGRAGPLQPQPLPVGAGAGQRAEPEPRPVRRCRAAHAGGDPRRPRSLVLDEAARAEPPVELDYLALVDPADFSEVGADHRGPAVLAGRREGRRDPADRQPPARNRGLNHGSLGDTRPPLPAARAGSCPAGPRRGRRRRRLRDRRADRRARRPARRLRAAGHQGAARRRLHPLGPGRHRGRARPRRHARRAPGRHAHRGRRAVRRGGRAHAGHRGSPAPCAS